MIETNSFSGGGRGGGLGVGASRLFLPFVTFLVIMGAVFLAGSIISSDTANPVAVLLLISGVCLGFYAQMRPWQSLVTFLWLVMVIDAIKRLTYATSNMSMVDVAYILAVPVIMMVSLYLRVMLLQWFAPDPTIDRMQIKKALPILALLVLLALGILGREGFTFGNLSKGYTLICYIPVAVAVPLMLSRPERWYDFSKHAFWISLVIGIYGLFQAWHGPFNFEYTYLQSGLTSTDSLLEDGHLRVFSLLAASSAFAGTMVIVTFYALYRFCLPYGRLQLIGWKPKAVVAFSLVVCVFSTQRGALFCGVATLACLPLFRRPKLFQTAFLAFVALFAALIVYIDQVWDFITWLDGALEPMRVNSFLQNNTHLLTFGARKDSFIALHDANTWTAFGQPGADIMSAHDMLTQLRTHNPSAYLWAQVNMAVVTFVIVWGLLLGSSIHISPINFFFWLGIGNLLYMYGNQRIVEVSKAEPEPILVLPTPVQEKGKPALAPQPT